MPLPRLIAHRGLSAHAPENTLAAVRAASDAGCDWVELDVQLLGDGTPVIWHDDNLERCSNSRARLVELERDELAMLDAGSWFGARFAGEPIALLDDALALLAERGMGLNLELKVGSGRDPVALAQAVVPRLKNFLAPHGLLVSSFDRQALESARELDSELPLGLLYTSIPRRWAEDARRLRPLSVHADWRRFDQERLIEIRRADIAVYAYTVNDPEAFKPWWEHGVTGVISDDPTLFRDS
ncbi:glycerophosphodiester phosphodiesterase family protein [Kushneria aurantia]|uniref:Glycerophosphodiester phosphodiesterase family protein n=1 Tax=Kushneria aurantia TaxID=504092 RepID=A0ABV6G3L8_9GAMM|nr:glycerophosphodiester phosphodiesterase family protein [Kushneria aurantia]